MSANASSNSSLHLQLDGCSTPMNMYLFTSYLVIYILLLLPLSVIVLYFGYQRWRKQRSVATAALMSHSDIFTFHMVALEMIAALGFCFYCYGIYANHSSVAAVGVYLTSINSPGQFLFHLLTCLERYLAVVYPVTYMGLRQSGGIRIRNISIVCVWLLSLGAMCVSEHFSDFYLIFTLLSCVIALVVISFCSLSLLCVLIRPRPGEAGGKREQVDQTKQRAFYTIMVITGALLVGFLSTMVSYVFYSLQFSDSEQCFSSAVALWFTLPSSLVLPLLFLHRAGKLPDCKHSTESG